MTERKALTLAVAVQCIIFGALLEVGWGSLEYTAYSCAAIFLALLTVSIAARLRRLRGESTKHEKTSSASRIAHTFTLVKFRIQELGLRLTAIYYERPRREGHYDGRARALYLIVVIPAIIFLMPLKLSKVPTEYAQYALAGIAVAAIRHIAVGHWPWRRKGRRV